MDILKYIIAGFLLLTSFIVQAESEVISPKEASALYSEKQAVIIDVREQDEWNEGHIAGAIHIPLKQLNTLLPTLQQYKDTTIITQCKSGGRSAKAVEELKSAGFSKVYSMDGGIKAWSEQGLATTK